MRIAYIQLCSAVLRADATLLLLATPNRTFDLSCSILLLCPLLHARFAISRSQCAVSMLWNWNTVDSCFISTSWHNSTRAQFAGSVIGVFFLVVAIEAVRRLGREYDRRLVAASRARQRKEAVAGGFGPSCSSSSSSTQKECPKKKAMSEKAAGAGGSGCCKRTAGSSSSSETGDDINLADGKETPSGSERDPEAALPVFK